MRKDRKYKNKGIKNFHFETVNLRLLGIYLYLQRPPKSDCKSTTECNEMIYEFCSLHKHDGSLTSCAIYVQQNWDEFTSYAKVRYRKYQYT